MVFSMYYITFLFFCKQKTAYDMRISDWSSYVCSSDRVEHDQVEPLQLRRQGPAFADPGLLFEACHQIDGVEVAGASAPSHDIGGDRDGEVGLACPRAADQHDIAARRSEEHTSELQSLMRISYAVFCLKKKKKHRKATGQYRDSIQLVE